MVMIIIVMNMKIMEIDLQYAQLRQSTPMEYQIMDPYPDSQGTILKTKNDLSLSISLF